MEPGPGAPCPRCATPLEVAACADVAFQQCPGCAGHLLRQADLLRVLERLAKDLAATLGPDTVVERVPDKGGGVSCPRCGRPMEHYGYMGTNLVMIDACAPCGVLWLDTDALGAMGLLYARTQRREAAREEALRQWSEKLDERAAALGQAREVERVMGKLILKRLPFIPGL